MKLIFKLFLFIPFIRNDPESMNLCNSCRRAPQNSDRVDFYDACDATVETYPRCIKPLEKKVFWRLIN